jgi:hypothetical protein
MKPSVRTASSTQQISRNNQQKKSVDGVRGLKNASFNSEKDQYYKFYLDSAQRAIEMMRKQHKAASLVRMNNDNDFPEAPIGVQNQNPESDMLLDNSYLTNHPIPNQTQPEFNPNPDNYDLSNQVNK